MRKTSFGKGSVVYLLYILVCNLCVYLASQGSLAIRNYVQTTFRGSLGYVLSLALFLALSLLWAAEGAVAKGAERKLVFTVRCVNILFLLGLTLVIFTGPMTFVTESSIEEVTSMISGLLLFRLFRK